MVCRVDGYYLTDEAATKNRSRLIENRVADLCLYRFFKGGLKLNNNSVILSFIPVEVIKDILIPLDTSSALGILS